MTKEEILEISWHRAITISRGKNKRGKLHLTNHNDYLAICNSTVHVIPAKYPRSMIEKAYDEGRICKHCLKLLEE